MNLLIHLFLVIWKNIFWGFFLDFSCVPYLAYRLPGSSYLPHHPGVLLFLLSHWFISYFGVVSKHSFIGTSLSFVHSRKVVEFRQLRKYLTQRRNSQKVEKRSIQLARRVWFMEKKKNAKVKYVTDKKKSYKKPWEHFGWWDEVISKQWVIWRDANKKKLLTQVRWTCAWREAYPQLLKPWISIWLSGYLHPPLLNEGVGLN
jgi:hypothetical protein